jgi:long-subunit acyl-CoA synthetase (AMP-forming)
MYSLNEKVNGKLKGAMISNSNLISANSVQAFYGFDYNSSDRYLSNIALSHIFE